MRAWVRAVGARVEVTRVILPKGEFVVSTVEERERKTDVPSGISACAFLGDAIAIPPANPSKTAARREFTAPTLAR